MGRSRWRKWAVVVQPYYVPSNVARFTAPAAELTFSLRWEPGKALFLTFRGDPTKTKSHAIAEHLFTAGVPSAGHESVRMNFCPVDNHQAPSNTRARSLLRISSTFHERKRGERMETRMVPSKPRRALPSPAGLRARSRMDDIPILSGSMGFEQW